MLGRWKRWRRPGGQWFGRLTTSGTTNAPLRDATRLGKQVRVLEAELARKNEIIADLSVLALQAKGMLKGKKRDKSE